MRERPQLVGHRCDSRAHRRAGVKRVEADLHVRAKRRGAGAGVVPYLVSVSMIVYTTGRYPERCLPKTSPGARFSCVRGPSARPCR